MGVQMHFRSKHDWLWPEHSRKKRAQRQVLAISAATYRQSKTKGHTIVSQFEQSSTKLTNTTKRKQ
jgi:hypothetical protein